MSPPSPSHPHPNSRFKKTIYTGTFISTPTLGALEVLENATVGVDEGGVIRFVERDVRGLGGEKGLDSRKHEEKGLKEAVSEWGWDWGKVEWVDGRERGGRKGEGKRWFFPGFVAFSNPDTHIHASQYPNTGLFGNSTLLDWLQKYTFPLEASFSSLSRAQHVYTRVITRTLAHGTTTASYYATLHTPATNLLSTLCFHHGQRAKIGRVCMDHPTFNMSYYRDESAEAAVSATQATIAHCNSIDPERGLVEPIITPRFAPSCTSALLHQLGALAKEYDLPIQTHIAENPDEVKLVGELFPDCTSYTDVYARHGLLTPRTVLGHAIWLSAEEKEVVKAHGAGVSHCPVSNSYISSGLCPVRSYLDLGIKVGLGTDVSGGWSGSMLVAAREALGVSRVLASVEGNKAKDAGEEAEKPKEEVEKEMKLETTDEDKNESNRLKLSVEEALYLATVGGAKCLNLESKIGTFEVGKEFDAQMIVCGDFSLGDEDELGHGGKGKFEVRDDNPVELWGQESWQERMAKWVFCGDDRNVEAVWVRGRKVHER